MPSYEENCRAYEISGNPQQDAFDYEENARYDYYSEMKTEMFDWCGEQADNEPFIGPIQPVFEPYKLPEGDDCPF